MTERSEMQGAEGSHVTPEGTMICSRPGCEEGESRINGYCSVYCEDRHDLERERDSLAAQVEAAEKDAREWRESLEKAERELFAAQRHAAKQAIALERARAVVEGLRRYAEQDYLAAVAAGGDINRRAAILAEFDRALAAYDKQVKS